MVEILYKGSSDYLGRCALIITPQSTKYELPLFLRLVIIQITRIPCERSIPDWVELRYLVFLLPFFLQSILEFQSKRLPITYLGLSITRKKSYNQCWKLIHLIENIPLQLQLGGVVNVYHMEREFSW